VIPKVIHSKAWLRDKQKFDKSRAYYFTITSDNKYFYPRYQAKNGLTISFRPAKTIEEAIGKFTHFMQTW